MTPVRPADRTNPHFASLPRRLAAMLYESLLLLGVLGVAFLLPHVAIGMAVHRVAPGGWLIAHALLVTGVYFTWCWRRSGQTLAMQTRHLRLERCDGTWPVPLGRAVLRHCLAWPGVLSGASLVWALFDRDRQFLHDRLAGTRLVRIDP